jgi:hypothetical protein
MADAKMFSIVVDAKPAIGFLDDLGRKQIPYAFSLALNRSANLARNMFLSSLPGHMILRTSWSKAGNKYGFNIQNSTKTNLRTTIYSRAPWTAIQETGGTKVSQKGGRLAVPTVMARTSPTKKIPKQKYVSNLKNKFVRGNQMFRRMAKGKIQYMYTLIKNAKVKPRLQFHDEITRNVNRVWPGVFDTALDQALRTARKK